MNQITVFRRIFALGYYSKVDLGQGAHNRGEHLLQKI